MFQVFYIYITTGGRRSSPVTTRADTQWAECDVIPTDGCWSRSRPSVIFLSRSDGWLEAWDIILEQAGH